MACPRKVSAIRRYLDETVGPPVARADAYERAVEAMLIALEGPFTAAGDRLAINQDIAQREKLHADMLAQYGKLDDLLTWQGAIRRRPFTVRAFRTAECVFTPDVRALPVPRRRRGF